MKYIWTIGLLLIQIGSSIALYGQSAEWNLDFEDWEELVGQTNLQDSVIENHIKGYPSKWFFNPNIIPEGTGIGQSTDATSGIHAVTLSGFYTYPVMRIQSGSDPLHPGWPINYRPSKLIGDYKAVLLSSTNATCDSLRAYVSLYLTKYNTNTSSRDTIGQGQVTLIERDHYQGFEVDVYYDDNYSIPDTVVIVLAKERFGHCGSSHQGCYECSHVYFDNLSLNNTLSIQDSPLLSNIIEIFPNPASQNFFIKTECQDCLLNISIIGSNGQIIKRYKSVSGKTEININDIGKGVYFVKVEKDKSEIYLYKKLIIK